MRNVSELDPDFGLAYYNRGIIFFSKGDLAKAIADFDRAIELDPIHTAAYASRGAAYRNMGDLDNHPLNL